jgi:glycosyltransferase involved in cell wall biosynthesis
MQIVINLFGGLLAFGWGAITADYASGARRGRTLETVAPYAPGEHAPPLSVVLAACNEEEKLPMAFRTLLAQEYPGPFEIVAVDDRSTDRTPELLDALAREAPPGKRVAVLHLTHLPDGWLGKTHALYQGARHATGVYVLFTDADIRFAPDALSRAVRYADAEGLDHLVSFFRLDLRGFWEHAFGLCFSWLFFLRFRPWRVRNPKTAEYLGVGGFNLVRRTTYEAIGTHRAIALEVADDMELGRRVKHSGFSSDVIGSGSLITVRWQEGLSGLMNGLTKNAYAGLDYSVWVLLRSVALLLLTVLWPFIGMFVARGRRGRAGYAFSAAAILGLGGWHARTGGIPAGYALTLPVSTLLLIAVMFRSAWYTTRNGGITWRDTFYPLDTLRARILPPVPETVAPSLVVGSSGAEGIHP